MILKSDDNFRHELNKLTMDFYQGYTRNQDELELSFFKARLDEQLDSYDQELSFIMRHLSKNLKNLQIVKRLNK